MRYESNRDIELRLKGSVVMFNKRPVIVQDVVGDNLVRITDIISDQNMDVKVGALDLSPSSMPLGYVLSEGKLFFAQRRPTRKFKQGLTRDNIFTFDALEKPNDKEMALIVRGAGMRPHVNPFSASFARAVLGEYPDVGTAFNKVREGKVKALPFSREWAVADKDDELCLLFRGDVVGYVGNDSVKLNREHFYLKESLELCLK